MPSTRRATRKQRSSQRGGFLGFLDDLFGSSTGTNANSEKKNNTSANGMLAPPVSSNAVPVGGRRKSRKSRKNNRMAKKSHRKTKAHRKSSRKSCRKH